MSKTGVFVVALVILGLVSPPSRAAEAIRPGPPWEKATGGEVPDGAASGLFYAPDIQQMLLLGSAKERTSIHLFDPSGQRGGAAVPTAPPIKEFHPYYQAAYDPGSKGLYCLSGGSVLYRFDLARKTWKVFPPAPELDGLSWHTLACDTEHGRLVVVGADKKTGNLGWSRTLVYDIATSTWSRLEVADEQVVQVHRQLVAIGEQMTELTGRIRLAWFRDPAGTGTEAERADLLRRCGAIRKLPQAEGFTQALDAVVGLLKEGKTLDALKSARAVKREIEEAAEAQYPVPCSRRNSPLAYDAQNKVFVLFGGDHEDYLMNDTWVLDLTQRAWQRMKPEVAPSPRAGHALFPLPKSGGVALYEGYLQTTSTDYGAAPYAPIDPIQLWRYDPKADRWDLAGSWPHPAKKETGRVPPVGHFEGYAAQCYAPPAIAADERDRIVLAACPGRVWFLPWKDFPSHTWLLSPDFSRPDVAGRAKLGKRPNLRLDRGGAFVAAFCETPERPAPTALDRLPENRWVRLPAPPRNPCRGCRQRDWGTAVWDSDRDQILLWGGGHCVRSASTVVHYSPVAGRIVEGFDADEPYGANGGGGFDSSLWNRPWVSTHNYNHYAYDPKCRLMVSGRGYLYDPDRMDWRRMERISLPFEFQWGSTVVETSPHGAIAWARQKGSDAAGLWLFDRNRGWTDLPIKPADKARLFLPYCDAHGMVYDAKRDRMLLSGVGGSYQKLSGGNVLAFDFKTHSLSVLTPENAGLGKTMNARELAYVEHADWVLIGDMIRQGDRKTGRLFTRVYDCGKNAVFLLDAGGFEDYDDPHTISYSTGWMYDAQRKLALVFTIRGEAWAMRVNPQTAKLLTHMLR